MSRMEKYIKTIVECKKFTDILTLAMEQEAKNEGKRHHLHAQVQRTSCELSRALIELRK